MLPVKHCFLFVLIALLGLTGCKSQMDRLKQVGKEPAMEQVSVPMAREGFQPIEWPDHLMDQDDSRLHKRYSNSLWKQGSRTFFQDRKARRVGDILNVVVRVSDKAELENETERTRDNFDDVDANSALGWENIAASAFSGTLSPSQFVDLNSTSTSTGTGTIEREEVIETEIAAMVTQILPNGNLIIHGDQEIRVNFEVRKVSVDGIVRPEDISAENSVDSNKIAEARISYGGRGQITDVQQPRIGNQIVDILSPF